MKKIYFIVIFILFINLGNILDITEEPMPSDIIVALGGGKDSRIKEGLELYIHNFSHTNKLVLPNKNYTNSVLIKGFLSTFISKNKIDKSNIINLENVKNTMEELIKIKKYLRNNNLKKVIFVSHPSHSLRIKLLANIIADYNKDNIQINLISADETKVWNRQYYFLEIESIKKVFWELLKIPYNLFKYTVFL